MRSSHGAIFIYLFKGGLVMEKGFFARLFDMSFSDFITVRLIKVLYILGIIAAGIGGLMFIISGFMAGVGMGILFLILSPVLVLFYILMVRVWLELILVVFRIAENTTQLVTMKEQEAATPPNG
jgi:uncharacterized membrane protein